MKIAVFAGTFDPITSGHEEIIKKSAEMFDFLIVALCVNVTKRAMFSIEKRMQFLNAVCQKYTNVKVVYHDGLLVDLMKNEGAIYNVRGLRNGKDYDYENEMNFINSDLMPEIVTVYLPCSAKNVSVSSTAVRELLSFNKKVDKYLPKEILDLIQK
jgi:pantetheine-phosphate adenylyltransferase